MQGALGPPPGLSDVTENLGLCISARANYDHTTITSGTH